MHAQSPTLTEPVTPNPPAAGHERRPGPGDPPITIRTHEPPRPRSSPAREPRLIAMMNQKGGVGKTTTTVNLGAAIARAGKRVLLIDLDPQAHLTLHFGLDPDELDRSVYTLLTQDRVTGPEVIYDVNEQLSVIPAEVNLAGAEAELAPKLVDGRAQRVLKHKLGPLLRGAEAPFDYVLIDCPPSLGLLTINALTLVGEVIVPMQAHFLSLQGLSKLLETVQLINQSFNPALAVTGMILCMHDQRTILAGEVASDLEEFLNGNRDEDVPWRHAVVFQPPVRRNIKLAECPSFGKTIYDYEPGCNGAEDYRTLAEAVMAFEPAGAGSPAAPAAQNAQRAAG